MSSELFKLKNHRRDLVLGRMTCGELAQALAIAPDPNIPESAKLQALRAKIGPRELRLLRLAAAESAKCWHAKIRSAAIIDSAPTVELTVVGGTPRPMAQVRATKTARRIAAANGIPLHNLRGRAAILVPARQRQSPPPPRQTQTSTRDPFMTLNRLLSQVRRSGRNTRRTLHSLKRRTPIPSALTTRSSMPARVRRAA